MGSLMKVARVARKYIKPSSPTPPRLRTFQLSLLDQLAPSVYNPMVFFYPMGATHDRQSEAGARSRHLQKSLSPLLTRFYPFAGRIKDHIYIDCNDVGVDFLEAKVNARLEDVLRRPHPYDLKQFLPVDIEAEGMGMGSHHLVHVQTNTFECGGMALGVCWSHKISDGGTVSTFMKGWSSLASGSANEVIPEYAASSLFPPTDSSITQHVLKLETDKTTTKRFVFHGSKITMLKARAASEEVPKPTRVEVVSSLLWKCATRASRATSGLQPLSMMSQSMNIRRRMSPPLPDTTIGNLVGYYIAKMEENNHNNTTLASLVAKQRQGKTEATNNYARKLQGENAHLVIRELFKEAGSLLRREDVDFFKCLSTCGDGLYDADFGWGKPIWHSLFSLGYKNTFALSQTRDGNGIEAWVTLKEDVMARFERDLELLAFASSNPSVLELALD